MGAAAQSSTLGLNFMSSASRLSPILVNSDAACQSAYPTPGRHDKWDDARAKVSLRYAGSYAIIPASH